MVERFFGGEQGAEDVHVELAVELILGHVLQRREAEYAGVVDEHIQLAESALGLVEKLLHLTGLRYVGLDGDSFAAALLDLGDDLIRPLATGSIIDDD